MVVVYSSFLKANYTLTLWLSKSLPCISLENIGLSLWNFSCWFQLFANCLGYLQGFQQMFMEGKCELRKIERLKLDQTNNILPLLFRLLPNLHNKDFQKSIEDNLTVKGQIPCNFLSLILTKVWDWGHIELCWTLFNIPSSLFFLRS